MGKGIRGPQGPTVPGVEGSGGGRCRGLPLRLASTPPPASPRGMFSSLSPGRCWRPGDELGSLSVSATTSASTPLNPRHLDVSALTDERTPRRSSSLSGDHLGGAADARSAVLRRPLAPVQRRSGVARAPLSRRGSAGLGGPFVTRCAHKPTKIYSGSPSTPHDGCLTGVVDLGFGVTVGAVAACRAVAPGSTARYSLLLPWVVGHWSLGQDLPGRG